MPVMGDERMDLLTDTNTDLRFRQISYKILTLGSAEGTQGTVTFPELKNNKDYKALHIYKAL